MEYKLKRLTSFFLWIYIVKSFHILVVGQMKLSWGLERIKKEQELSLKRKTQNFQVKKKVKFYLISESDFTGGGTCGEDNYIWKRIWKILQRNK